MLRYLLAMALFPTLVFAWLAVQRYARVFAERHPQFGPAREEGAGCGGSCRCSGGGSCSREAGRDAGA